MCMQACMYVYNGYGSAAVRRAYTYIRMHIARRLSSTHGGQEYMMLVDLDSHAHTLSICAYILCTSGL